MWHKKLVVVLAVIVAILIVILIWLTIGWLKPSKYSVVFLKDGNVYVGQLSKWPTLKLTDPWVLTNNQGRLTINSWKNTVWGPENVIYFQKDSISLWSNLRDDSAFVQAIHSGGASLPQLPAQLAPTSTQK